MPWSQHSDPGLENHADAPTLQAYAAYERTPDDATLRHIARCPQCMADLVSLRSQLPARPARESRAHCPPVEAIQAYALDQLKGAQKRSVEAHIKECLRCAAEVAASREFLVEPAPQRAGVAAAAQEMIRRVLATLVPVSPEVNLALRDLSAWDEDAKVQVFAAEGVKVSLRKTADEAAHGTFLLNGEISEDEAASPFIAISARLLRVADEMAEAEPTVVAEVPIVADSFFEFDHVPPGAYQIELLLSDRLIVVASVVV